jgi:hypothetical protein
MIYYLIHYLFKMRMITRGLALRLADYYYSRAERTDMGVSSREPGDSKGEG